MWYLITSFVLIIYMMLNLILPHTVGGISPYIAHFIFWTALTLISLKLLKHKNIKIWQSNNPLVTTAAIIAVLQIVILIFTGIFTAFAKSPYQFTPINLALNIGYFLSMLLGMELSRAYLTKTCCKQKPTLAIGLIALLYATITIPLSKFLTLDPNSPLELAKFSASIFLPALAESLFTTYLAFLAGLIPAITFRGILTSFEWLCPILPNPSWEIRALVSVMIPTIGFLTIHQSTTPRFIRKHERPIKIKKASSLGWTAIGMIGVLIIWGSTGMLGFRPTVISSGSMRPTMDVGDIAITIQTTLDTIKPGDVIQFWQEDTMVVHRVVDIQYEGSTRYFITKGDDNPSPDPTPIHQDLVVGKLAFTIPKIGWASIAIKTLFAEAYAFFTTNPTYAYTTLAIIIPTSAFGIHRYRNQPLKKLRRRLKR